MLGEYSFFLNIDLFQFEDEIAFMSTTNTEQHAISQQLIKLASTIKGFDSYAADRLYQLQSAIMGETPADPWVAVDLYQTINPDAIIQHYKSRNLRSSRLFDMVNLLRNTIILLPLILTGLSIAQAVQAYSLLLVRDPHQATQPFLYLWEQGFNGTLPSVFTPSETILLDSSLLTKYTLIICYCVPLLSV